ncbi:FecR family protein [Filimonas effusa]|uniref:FecR family protein n=1 Tax=Filimonas effusa TaxID=2508721 RepID=A0A4V1MAT1_9BACT|nr:FecR family protein [Filimonas effusa]RXK86956.1 FecR family protein [Filimonas effusa]
MSETAIYIALLLHKLREKEPLSPQEQQDLEAWRQLHPGSEVLMQKLQDRSGLIREVEKMRTYDTTGATEELFRKLAIPLPAKQVNSTRRLQRSLAVAAVLLLLAVGTWLWLPADKAKKPLQAAASEVAPGGNKATLTLADGSVIVLDSAHNGLLAQQGVSDVSKQNGLLIYKAGDGNAPVQYNTMKTPRGGEFSLVLPDGSKVWLNAASSLTYPTVFNGSERVVELTGEAFFEIAPQQSMPFKVKVNKMEVAVLGTSFNIMAYDNEPAIRTTLVNGRVKVATAGQSLLLQPGQQARAAADIRLAGDVDVEEEIAWKKGKFMFGEATSMKTIMRQIANWYDVEVVFHGDVPNRIGGSVARSVPLSQLLKVLETAGAARFEVNNKRIDVYPSS